MRGHHSLCVSLFCGVCGQAYEDCANLRDAMSKRRRGCGHTNKEYTVCVYYAPEVV